MAAEMKDVIIISKADNEISILINGAWHKAINGEYWLKLSVICNGVNEIYK